MGTFEVRVIQLDLTNPESFQYQVWTDDDKFVAGFGHMSEANNFIVLNGGTPQDVRVWQKGIQATSGTPVRKGNYIVQGG